MREFWRSWLEARGVNARLLGVRDHVELLQELQSTGALVTEVEVIHYPMHYTLSEELARFESRISSDAWDIPGDVFDASMEELRAWVGQEYGSLEQPREDELRFAIDVARFER
jgi:hypothetical protein